MDRSTAKQIAEKLRRYAAVCSNRQEMEQQNTWTRGNNAGQAAALKHAAQLIEQNLTATPEQSRERFELWYQVECPFCDLRRHALFGNYFSEATQKAWQAWEGSREWNG